MTMFGVRPRLSGVAFQRIDTAGRLFHKSIKDAELARIAAEEADRERKINEWLSTPRPDQDIPVRDIIGSVAWLHGLTTAELRSERRSKPVVIARQEAMWLAKRYTSYSLPRIGAAMGGRDHTTVLHGVRRHQARIDALRAKRRGG